MLAIERQKQIIYKVNKQQNVKVSALSKLFQVTEETIRRDLEKLEAEGKLTRTHGGAVSVEADDFELPFIQRETLFQQEKNAIATAAVQLIQENDILFLDASSTALYMAKKLPNISLIVLTNALSIAIELGKHSNIQVTVLGGTLSKTSPALFGPQTIEAIEKYHVDKMFFSCEGLDEKWGISDSNEQQAMIKRRMAINANEKILLMDHSKLNKKAFSCIGSHQLITKVVVDEAANKQVLENLLKEREVIYAKIQ